MCLVDQLISWAAIMGPTHSAIGLCVPHRVWHTVQFSLVAAAPDKNESSKQRRKRQAQVGAGGWGKAGSDGGGPYMLLPRVYDCATG